MAQSRKTAFDLDFDRKMQDPEFRAEYERERARIDAIDRLVRALDAEREAQGLSKAELARRMDAAPEAIRRLFSQDRPNPTLTTYVTAAQALDMELAPVPRKRRSGRRRDPAAA